MNVDSTASDRSLSPRPDDLFESTGIQEIPLANRRSGLLVPVLVMRHRDDVGAEDMLAAYTRGRRAQRWSEK